MLANSKTGAVQVLIPREHGATAMLLTPFFAAAILLRGFYWPEFVALLAVAAAFALKEPLVVLARQRFVWKHEHAETRAATEAAFVLATILLSAGVTLILVRDWRQLALFMLGATVFTVLAVSMNVRNRQRSQWFQIASAGALSATCLVACLSAIGHIPDWCWFLWVLCALQAVAGIFVVHARLEARIALRNGTAAQRQSRRMAFFTMGLIIISFASATFLERLWIAAALALTAGCYLAELQRQRHRTSLEMSLKRVGLQTLAQSIIYTSLVVVGLWRS